MTGDFVAIDKASSWTLSSLLLTSQFGTAQGSLSFRATSSLFGEGDMGAEATSGSCEGDDASSLAASVSGTVRTAADLCGTSSCEVQQRPREASEASSKSEMTLLSAP